MGSVPLPLPLLLFWSFVIIWNFNYNSFRGTFSMSCLLYCPFYFNKLFFLPIKKYFMFGILVFYKFSWCRYYSVHYYVVSRGICTMLLTIQIRQKSFFLYLYRWNEKCTWMYIFLIRYAFLLMFLWSSEIILVQSLNSSPM